MKVCRFLLVSNYKYEFQINLIGNILGYILAQTFVCKLSKLFIYLTFIKLMESKPMERSNNFY